MDTETAARSPTLETEQETVRDFRQQTLHLPAPFVYLRLQM